MKKFLSYLMFVFLLATSSAMASPLNLGTASGGLMIYYNNIDVSGDGVISGYDEKPSNQAYIRAQFGYGNTNGMGFQFSTNDLGGGVSFNSIFSGQPTGQSQFGFDLISAAPTYTSAGGVTLPSVSFADNLNNSVSGAFTTSVFPTPYQQAWAINDYKEGPIPGPSDPAAGIINSLFRGTSFTIDSLNVTPGSNGTYKMDIAGKLLTDGFMHWYNPAQGITPLSAWNLSDTLTFEGTLIYDPYYAGLPWGTLGNTYPSGYENGSDQRDFYAGTINVYAQPVPIPGAVWLLGTGLIGLVGIRRKYRK